MENNYKLKREISFIKTNQKKRRIQFAFSFLFVVLFGSSFGHAQTIQLGSGSAVNSYFPFYYLFEKGYTQTIYTATELTQAGMTFSGTDFITKIRYLPDNSTTTEDWEDWTIYLGNTSQNDFQNTSDWIAVSQLTQVFDGQVASNTTGDQWFEITLDSPFQWDGTSNIVVAVNQTTQSWGNNPSWRAYTLAPSSGSKGIYVYRDGASYDPATPPTGTVSNTVAQIQFEVNTIAPCAGVPEAGQIDGNATFGSCFGNPLTLSVSGADLASGMTYQWQQQVSGGTWADIPGANGFTLNLPSGISDTTEFRFVVVCNNGGDSDTTNVVTVTLNNYTDCYCTPTYTNGCSSNERISSFSLTGDNGTAIINNGSGCSVGGYGDFTNLPPVDLYIDSTYTGNVVTDYYYPEDESVRIWIDFNNNGIFENSEIITSIAQMTSGGDAFTFTIPPAYLGLHRMRVRLVDWVDVNSIDPCNNESYGETEDYMVNILSANPCIAPINVGFDTINPYSVSLSWADINTPNASSWNIEYDTTGFVLGTGNQVFGLGTTQYSATNLLPNTTYDFYIQTGCNTNDSSSWVGPFTVTTKCAFFALPFVESFEDNSNSRNCWDNEYVLGQADWTYGSGSNIGSLIAFPYEGEKNAVFVSTSGTNSPVTKLVSPTLVMNAQDSVALSFAYAQEMWFSDQNKLKVYAKTETDNDWIELASYENNINFWTVETLYITPDSTRFAGSELQIAFEGINNYGYANTVDDVQVSPCTITPGINDSTNVCRLDGTIDLNTVVTVGETWGRWEFPANSDLIDGTFLDVSTMASGTYEIFYIVKTICAVDTTVAIITVYPPSSAGEGGTVTVCKNEPLDLFAALSGSVDMSGSWYDPSGNALPSSQPNAPNLGAKYNYFYVASNNVCPADTAIVEVIVEGDCDYWSVEEEAFNDISIYPNPTTDFLNIVNPSNASALRVEILDMNGRIVLSDEKALHNVSKGEINLRHLETGVYTLRIYNSGGQKTFKVVKQ